MNACFTWAQSLQNLLHDSDGVKLFLLYLQSEGQQYADALHFWFACQGLKNHHQVEKTQRLVKLIYKNFIMKSALPINEDLRRQIMRNLKSPQCLEPPITLFDEAQAQIEYLINKTTYPNFLKSDMYLQYLQSAENPVGISKDDLSCESSSSTSPVSNKDLGNLASGIGPLPTLHEGMEFNVHSQPPLLLTPGTSVSTGYHTPVPRLTKDMLLKSQKHRALDIRPKSETYAGLMYRSNGVHAGYNSYNPVSRQDSEMQSLSSHSDARTESDTISITDSLMDGRRSRYKSSEEKKARQLAARNRETNMNHPLIPRTQRVDVYDKCRPMDCHEHAALLTQKLEHLKREQESQEQFHRRLKESDSMSSLEDKSLPSTSTAPRPDVPPPIAPIPEKFHFADDNDQDILDEHVSRVFSDHSRSTSPGLASPKISRSPQPPRWPQTRLRRERDGFSTFSADSGNVHDFSDTLTKSKSNPEYYNNGSQDERCFTRASSYRRTSSKKTDLTDSGVSVVSDSTGVAIGGVKDSRVLNWLMESNKGANKGPPGPHSDMVRSSKHGSKRIMGGGSVAGVGGGSRSSSCERAAPAQPFIADPNMPPLPLPNTDVQLEEIRRRLMMPEDESGKLGRSRLQRQSNKYYYPGDGGSGASTLRKKVGRERIGGVGAEDTTTVVFSFCDEQFPYRTKIPGTQVTLRQFKEFLPKKGNYRYFFRTICEELGNDGVHEEVSNDGEVLPLWEGKIMAQVKQVFPVISEES